MLRILKTLLYLLIAGTGMRLISLIYAALTDGTQNQGQLLGFGAVFIVALLIVLGQAFTASNSAPAKEPESTKDTA